LETGDWRVRNNISRISARKIEPTGLLPTCNLSEEDMKLI
jgi:hypothetical protein